MFNGYRREENDPMITEGVKQVIRSHCDQMPSKEKIIRARNLARIYCIDRGDYPELARIAGVNEEALG